ncbi:MAG TPA: hypothetical protein VF549_07495 [Solirubrobacteraceae bacterium]|jgi:hypothetical protein
MPSYLLHHEHAAADCDIAFAAWAGFDSPLRHRPAVSTCLTGGHTIIWQVDAPTPRDALALLPRYVRLRTVVTGVREIEIP